MASTAGMFRTYIFHSTINTYLFILWFIYWYIIDDNALMIKTISEIV